MREIKFRGKTKEGKWVYGSLVNNLWQNSKTKVNYCEIITTDSNYLEYYDCWEDIQEDNGVVSVIPETVGQLLFTNPYSESFYDGDIVDIGQTINGCSQFVLKQGVYGIDIYYHDRINLKYEYNVFDFLNMLMYNELGEVKVIRNIHDK